MLQVGLRSENIMITQPDSYRPPLNHASVTSDHLHHHNPHLHHSSHQWTHTVPAPKEPATSARGAPSVFRHHSTGPSSAQQQQQPQQQPQQQQQQAISFDPPPPSQPRSSSASSQTDQHHSQAPPRTTDALDRTPPIRLRNLSHVVELAKEDTVRRRTPDESRKYEISSMPVGDVIEMVAALLTKITTTNDRQHEATQRQIVPSTELLSGGTTSSVLAFHGKNVPSITIVSYLSRIHKYCPTTYEVFLSLLVYFDRMTESVNKGVRSSGAQESSSEPRATQSKHMFIVDSFNIHRLVIAGVTCASKFFSDVFYTNSRYAKVGGLPLAELNHLELQFLILNDFRLSVSVEELNAYGTMLVQFFAREQMANADLRAQVLTAASSTPQSEQRGQQYQEAGKVGA